MLKNVSKFEIMVENRLYHFFCDNDSPIEHVKEALFQFANFVGKIQEAARNNANQPPPPSPEAKPEEQNAQSAS